MEAARAIAPRIRAEADRIDREADLGRELVEAMAAAGLFRLLVPDRFGGAEADLPGYLLALEEIAHADASAGWCVGQACNFARNACTYLSEAVAAEVFGHPRAVVANGQQPGTATRQPGGYRVSGCWNFSTNVKNATWTSAICRVRDVEGRPCLDAERRPLVRSMLLPANEVRIVDAWNVAGLRGTGTHHFVVEDRFVPEEYSFAPLADQPRENAPLYLFGIQSVFALGFATVALGTARAALDALVDLAGAKAPRASRGLLRDQPLTQLELGRAEGQLRAARALLRETVEQAWDAATRTGSVALEQTTAIRLSTTHAFHAAVEVVDAAYTLGGATSIFPDSPLQRPFQDIHAISQHIQARESHFQSVGRVLLGLDPDSEMF